MAASPRWSCRPEGAIHDHAQALRPHAAGAGAHQAVPEDGGLLQLARAQEPRPRRSRSPAAARQHRVGAARAPLLRGRAAGSSRRLQAGSVRALPQRHADEPDQRVRAAVLRVPVPTGTRFQTSWCPLFNEAGNPVRDFIFNEGTANERHVSSPDPGRALITGLVDGDLLADDTTFEHTTRSRSRSCAASGTRRPTSTTTPRRRSRTWPRTTRGSSPSSPTSTVRAAATADHADAAGRGGHGGLHETAGLIQRGRGRFGKNETREDASPPGFY